MKMLSLFVCLCALMLAASATFAAPPAATNPGTPSPAGYVTVPNLGLCDKPAKWNEILQGCRLKGNFVAAGKAPTEDCSFKYAGQSHAPGSFVPEGTVITVSIYQKFDGNTESANVKVPDLSAFNGGAEMKFALERAGLVCAFRALPAPSADKSLKFASQSPAADTNVPRGTPIVVSIYQPFTAHPPVSVMPDLSGMTVKEANARLKELGLDLMIDEIDTSAKAADPASAGRIWHSDPVSGASLRDRKKVSLMVYAETSPGSTASADYDAMVAGPESGLMGTFTGTFTMHGTDDALRQNCTIVIIRRTDGSYNLGVKIKGEDALREHDATITVHNGELSYEYDAGPVAISLRFKVSGDDLLGLGRAKAEAVQAIEFRATRKR